MFEQEVNMTVFLLCRASSRAHFADRARRTHSRTRRTHRRRPASTHASNASRRTARRHISRPRARPLDPRARVPRLGAVVSRGPEGGSPWETSLRFDSQTKHLKLFAKEKFSNDDNYVLTVRPPPAIARNPGPPPPRSRLDRTASPRPRVRRLEPRARFFNHLDPPSPC